MTAFSLKIAPKHDTKICYPSIAAVTAEMGGFFDDRSQYAENVKKEEAGTVLLPQ